MKRFPHLGFIFAAFAVCLAAQPPAKKPAAPPALPEGYPPETEEAAPAPIKRRVIIEEEGPPPVTVPPFCHYARVSDLTRASMEAKNPALKTLLASYAIAFDHLVYEDGKVQKVCPIPFYRENEKFPHPFGVFPLNAANEPMKAIGVDKALIKRIEHFEEILAEEARKLLNPPGFNKTPAQEAPAAERAAAAEQFLSAALNFFDTSRDLGKRRGPGWDGVRSRTVEKLRDARLERLRIAAEGRDWATVRSLGTRLATLYPNDPKLEQVYAMRLKEAVVAAGSDQLADLERSRELLVEFESRFPQSANPVADEVRAALKAQKDTLFEKARQAVRTENKEAVRYIRTLEAIDPNYPGLRDLQSQLKGDYAVLNVGVARMPRQMSPVNAFTDSDRMAVELLFESLLTPVPDEFRGLRYEPSLAAALPGIVKDGREVRLLRPVEWAGLPKQYADAGDVAGTIEYYKGEFRRAWPAYSTDWLNAPTIESQSSLRLTFANTHPYPPALLDFKILPARWLQANGLKPDDPKFSSFPYGTGPYKALPGADGRVSTFTANPGYSRRPGHAGQPFIREIRFVDVSRKLNLPAEFKTEQLHLLPDVPTSELAKFTAIDPAFQAKAAVVTAPQPRRIWILAMNQRSGNLASVPLRRGLGHAIDRETILNEVHRHGGAFHKPLNSPFPAGSWAVPKAAPSLYDANAAVAQFKAHFESAAKPDNANLTLIYPTDDPRALATVERIKKQIEDLGTLPQGKVNLLLRPLSAEEFQKAIARGIDYDLAYLSVDYPDDWYCHGLAAMLDPNAIGAYGRNLGGYLGSPANSTADDQTLARNLDDIRRYADFSGRLESKTHELHKNFLRAMPFVPLWQLDRHMVISHKLKIYFGEGLETANPQLLPPSIFTQIQRWKLD